MPKLWRSKMKNEAKIQIVLFSRFFEVETCRSVARSKEKENCVYVSEWRRKNGKIDPTHSCPMNVQVDLPSEAAFVTDSALILAEKLLVALVSNFTKLN